MKKPLLLAILLYCVQFASYATVRTVCNMPYSPGQYTSFTAAQTAAINGDTIYVHGSSINYGAITVNKQLTIIGTGHNPNKQVPLTSNFTNITLGYPNCRLIGLVLENITTTSFPGLPTGTTVKRCKFLGSGPMGGIYNSLANVMDNWLIEGNVFISTANTNIYLSSTTNNTTIRNNIFCSNLYAIAYNSSLTTPFTFSITNNLFLGNTSSTFGGSIYQAMINNNIFYRSSPQGTNTGCTMNNNISFACVITTFSATGTNNLVGVNPQFINFPLAGATFDYTHDYRLASGSPGLVNGTDGTDRGVYGGFGYKFNMTGEPAIPEILFFAITSPTVISPGGTLTISVKSKRIR